ncbi:MAG: DUF333 domain-containing protein [Anaerolineae bacterium]|nr:DUF333 domain-containing protein [Anaerolineae bacterium]
MIRRQWFIAFGTIAVAVLTACTSGQSTPTAQANIANPASTYCAQNGGKLELRSEPTGAVTGICVFPDGSECEEWAYSRGECKPGDSLLPPPGNEGPFVFDDMYAAGIDWMDHLKTCTPYEQSYMNPILQVKQVNIIKGHDGEACVMSRETEGQFWIKCRLNEDGIKVLTRDELYEQMKAKTASGDTSEASTEIYNSQCILESFVTPQP